MHVECALGHVSVDVQLHRVATVMRCQSNVPIRLCLLEEMPIQVPPQRNVRLRPRLHVGLGASSVQRTLLDGDRFRHMPQPSSLRYGRHRIVRTPVCLRLRLAGFLQRCDCTRLPVESLLNFMREYVQQFQFDVIMLRQFAVLAHSRCLGLHWIRWSELRLQSNVSTHVQH